MARTNPTIIVGHLDTSEIEKSVNDIVQKVANASQTMATKFETSMGIMKNAMKDFAVTQKVSVDLIKEAWREMSSSFDAMVRAQGAVTGSGRGSGGNANGAGNAGNSYPDNTVGQLENMIALETRRRKEMELGSQELRNQNSLIAEQRNLLQSATTSGASRVLNLALNMQATSLQDAKDKLATLEQIQKNYANTTRLSVSEQNRLANAIARTKKQIETLQAKQPKTLKQVLGMDESSIDAIARKMQALKRVSIDPQNTTQVRRLGDEYQRLKRLQAELMGQNIQLTHSNNYLAQSFGYIRNRVVYALTLGAATSFVKQIYEIRGQYEMLERSLGILIGSFQKGSQVFQQLNAMAVESPFTLIELGTAAKQLSAYNFEANQIVNTTRRLADISAALGVPMERIVYNLGQIKAQGALTARDARDFANAGLAIIPALADYFSVLEQRVVTTGDVYDRMSKKMVAYSDVMAVINQMTDEGGKFFDFQAKQADTLRVKMANLSLAWNNMLNAIGESNQNLLALPVETLKVLFKHWESLSHIIKEVVVALGAYKAWQLIVNKTIGQTVGSIQSQILAEKRAIATNLEHEAIVRRLTASEKRQIATQNTLTKADYERILAKRKLTAVQAMSLVSMNKENTMLHQALISTGTLTRAQVNAAKTSSFLSLTWQRMSISLKALGASMKAFAMASWPLMLMAAMYEVYSTWSNYSEKIKDVNRGVTEDAKEKFGSITEFLKDYEHIINRLRTKTTLENGDVVVSTSYIPKDEAERAWETMRKKIEESTAASNQFLQTLEQENNLSERLSQGFGLLEKLRDVHGVLQTIDEKAVSITNDIWGGVFGEGLKSDLEDYVNSLKEYWDVYGKVVGYEEEEKFAAAIDDLKELRGEIQATTKDLADLFNVRNNWDIEQQREGFETYISRIAQEQEMSAKQTRILRIEMEKSYYEQAKELLNQQIASAVGANKRLLEQRLKDLETEFNSSKSLQDTFFTWLQETQASEVQKRFGNMSKEEIAHIDWSKKEWADWAKNLAKSFTQEYGLSFNDFEQKIREANTWSINIPVYFNTIGQDISDIVKDYESRTGKTASAFVKNAKSQLEIIEHLQSEQAKAQAQLEASRKAGGEYWEQNKLRLGNENQSLIDQIHAYGAVTKAEEKAAKAKNKTKTSKKDVLGDALAKEVEMITNITKKYKEYWNMGVNSTDAINKVAKEYNKTLDLTNSTLAKFGITGTKTASELAQMDLRATKAYVEDLLKTPQAKGNAKGVEALEKAKANLATEITKEDYTKYVDSLNSALSKLNEEYELSLDLQANPELGESFAAAFEIPIDNLPKTLEDYSKRYVELLNKYFKAAGQNIELPSLNLTNDDLNAFKIMLENGKISQQAYDAIVKGAEQMRQKTKKESDEHIKDWHKLIEKYGEFESRISKIQKEAIDERVSFVKQYGTSEQQGQAIKLSEKIETTDDPEAKQELINQLKDLTTEIAGTDAAKINIKVAIDESETTKIQDEYFNEFQKSPEWLIAIGDLSGLTHKALRTLIRDLQDFQRANNKLSPEQTKKLSRAIKTLQREMRKDNPFLRLKDVIEEARDRVEPLRKDLEKLEAQYEPLNKKVKDNIKLTASEQKQYNKLGKEIDDTKKKITLLGKVSAKEIVDALNEAYSGISTVTNSISEMFAAFGNEEAAEALKTLSSIADKAMQFAQIGAAIGGGWGAAIGGLLGGLMGLFTSLADIMSGNADITKKIEISERTVKRLENAYKRLDDAIKHAFGTEVMGITASMIENRKLQLTELKRQEQLELSRTSKFKDEDKIIDLQGQIMDMEQEIKQLQEDIVNNFLNISSASDAVSDMVATIIDALRDGEDAMASFNETINDMIANMIKQVVASQVIGPLFQSAWEDIAKRLQDRSNTLAQKLAYEQKEYDNIASSEGKGYIFYNNPWGRGINVVKDSEVARNTYGRYATTFDAWKAYQEEVLKQIQDEIDKANTPTMDDVRDYAETLRGISPEIEGYIDTLNDILREMGLIKDTTKDKSLSLLQQGIQGITEDTAGALEGYLNIVSQRMFYHSTLLEEIRDRISSFDANIQLGTLGQMLLQLQNSYQVQMSIQNILQGTLTPSGRAFTVELAS